MPHQTIGITRTSRHECQPYTHPGGAHLRNQCGKLINVAPAASEKPLLDGTLNQSSEFENSRD